MHVLIAGDDAVSRRLLQASLSHAGYQVETAANGAEALRTLQEHDRPRLAVLDWMMPEMDGVEVCREVRKLRREQRSYIILLTAKEQQNEIAKGLEAGADDCITKPFDLQELKARLRSGERILGLQEQLACTREELRKRATHDSLTGLWNRGAILELLNSEVVRSIREDDRVSVILADFDYLKRVNDTHGQPAGDAVLREAGRRMQESLRVYDSVGRYGGEEFLVVSPGCGLAEVAEQAERLRRAVGGTPIHVPGGGNIVATMSLGVATISPETEQQEDLLRAAHEALQAAKRKGRNRVEISSQIPV
jgi:two-component system cell cycle response regulator